jgi:hypothetical protein
MLAAGRLAGSELQGGGAPVLARLLQRLGECRVLDRNLFAHTRRRSLHTLPGSQERSMFTTLGHCTPPRAAAMAAPRPLVACRRGGRHAKTQLRRQRRQRTSAPLT